LQIDAHGDEEFAQWSGRFARFVIVEQPRQSNFYTDL